MRSGLSAPGLVCAGFFFTIVWVQASLSRADDANFSGMRWRNIGPAVAGGRVAAVAGTNANPYLYYFGAAGGGVWRTTNGGLTWQDVFGAVPTASIGAIAIAPSNQNIVWVGTGESKPRNDISLGDGVWSSADGGTTWTHASLTSQSIARILIDRRDPNVVLVGALGNPYADSPERGVYRTVDGGKTWRQTLYVGPASGVSDLAWDPRGNQLVFAGIWQFRRVPWNFTSGGPLDGLYRSRDGGITWQHLTGNGLPSGIMGRIGIAVAPSNPQRVYALIQSSQGALWRSDDAGDHWHLVTTDDYVNQRPFYMSRLEVDPRNPNHLFFLSEDLVESFDGGKTIFNNVNAVHQDHHGMWIATDGKRMIEANDGGAPISLDGGKTWDWRYNVTIAQIYRVGYDMAFPYNVCGGMQDNDSYCGPSDSLNPLGITNVDWLDAGSDGDGSWTWPDPLDSNLIWNVDVRDLNGQLTVYDKRTRESYDVTPYVRDTNGANIAGLPYRFNWEAPVAFSRAQPGVVYFGGNVVWQTADRGRHWKQISPDLTLNDPTHQLVAGGPINTDTSGAEFYDTLLDIGPSPLNGSIIWVGTDDGLVQVTRDGGSHWANVTPAVAAYGRVETVEPSPFSESTAFVVVDRHVMGDPSPYAFRTNDFGAHWTALAGDLPNETVHVIRQDLHNPDVLYLGSETGVWVSLNSGMHWQRLNGNFPTASVHDLRIQPRENDLIAATHGRGFWILDDLKPIEAYSNGHLFQPRTAYAYFRWWKNNYGSGAGECCAPQDEFVGENPAAGALISFFLPGPARRTPTLEIRDVSGRTLAHLKAANNAGVNRAAWDLADDAPVPWLSARSWNQGLSQGAPAVPGTYHVVLDVDGQSYARTLSVKPDPRAQWTQADYEKRREFLSRLDRWLSDIDTALNNLERIRAKLFKEIEDLKSRGSRDAKLAQLRELLHEAQSVSALISSNPRNSEDNQWRPDKLRERLLILIDVYSDLAQGPPLAPHYREAAEIKAQYDTAMSRYRTFLSRAANGGYP